MRDYISNLKKLMYASRRRFNLKVVCPSVHGVREHFEPNCNVAIEREMHF